MRTKRLGLTLLLFVFAPIVVGMGMMAMGNNKLAPSYEEISQTMHRIFRRDINPQGPEVGSDGIKDDEINEAWAAYSRT